MTIYKKLLQKDGKEKYIRKIMEELTELSCAISHYHDDKISPNLVADEHADVLLQLEKLDDLMGPGYMDLVRKKLFMKRQGIVNYISVQSDDH